MNLPHIYLIGFMGSGKSYVGKRLAESLDRDFLDLDDYLEASAGRSISNIFSEKGEAYFRKLEREALRSTAELRPSIISCGGGTPCFHDNISWINSNGISIFLDASPELLYARLRQEFAHRPLLARQTNLLNFIRQQLDSRLKFYQQAHYRLSFASENKPVAEMILDLFSNEFDHLTDQ